MSLPKTYRKLVATRFTTDFRDVFSEVVVKHLGADAATATKVFPGYQVKPGTFRAILRS